MKICKKLAMLATAAACLAGVLPAQASPTALFEANVASAGFGTATALVYGNRFTMTSTVTATALGLYDYMNDGFAEAHQVGLWNAAGALLASVSFGPGQMGTLGPGVTPGPSVLPNSGMRYIGIASVLLEAGQAYWLAATFPVPLADGVGLLSGLTSSYASGFTGGYAVSADLVRHNVDFNFGDVIGVNLLTADTAGPGDNTVPEPATLIQVLTLLGALALVRRRRA